MAIDDNELYEPTSILNTQIEDCFPGAAQTCKKGQMFLDKFNTDKFCHHWWENLYYPFVSQPEWHLALWLLHSGISMSATDEFLLLEIVSFPLNFGVSPIIHCVLTRSKHCTSRLIPQRNYVDVPSCYQVGHTGNPCRSKLLTQWRLPCICTGVILWAALHPSSTILYLPTTWNSSLTTYTQQRQGNIVYIQSGWQVMMHGKCRHVFITCTLESWSYNKQSHLPHDATLIGTICSSDKTNILMLSGGCIAHPPLIGLANIKMSTRLKLLSHSFMLTALLPIPQFYSPK